MSRGGLNFPGFVFGPTWTSEVYAYGGDEAPSLAIDAPVVLQAAGLSNFSSGFIPVPTPQPDALVFVLLTHEEASAAIISGMGITNWRQVAYSTIPTGGRACELWAGTTANPTGADMRITNNNTMSTCRYCVFQVLGWDVEGGIDAAFVQIVAGSDPGVSGPADSILTINYNTTTLPGNLALGVSGNYDSSIPFSTLWTDFEAAAQGNSGQLGAFNLSEVSQFTSNAPHPTNPVEQVGWAIEVQGAAAPPVESSSGIWAPLWSSQKKPAIARLSAVTVEPDGGTVTIGFSKAVQGTTPAGFTLFVNGLPQPITGVLGQNKVQTTLEILDLDRVGIKYDQALGNYIDDETGQAVKSSGLIGSSQSAISGRIHSPLAVDKTPTEFTPQCTVEELLGTVYGVLTAYDAARPTAAQIIAGLDGDGLPALAVESFNVTQRVQRLPTIGGLTPNTLYAFYFVHVGADNSNVTGVGFKTLRP